MKTSLAALSLAAVVALTGGVMAQNVNPPNVDVNAGAAAGADVDVSMPTFDSLLTTLSTNAAVDFSTVNESTTIRIMKLSSLDASTVRGEELDAALAANAAARTSWPATLEGNAAIKAKLDAEGVAAGDVIAIESGADGSLTIWVDDRM